MSDFKFEHKKRLMPKSAQLVRKYQKGIRASFGAFVVMLTLVFIIHTSRVQDPVIAPAQTSADSVAANHGTSVSPEQSGKLPSYLFNTALLADDYVVPFTDKSQGVTQPLDDGVKVRAAMVTLTRNSDLWELVKSIRHVEDRFNHRYHYDWVFLNDKPFTEEFKKVTSALVSGKTKYGLIPEEHWSIPDFIDMDKFDKARKAFAEEDVPYGTSIPYRHMCRYQSGFFWQSELLDEYEYYWRVDHDITLFCDIQYDLFKFMKVNNKKYGFILSVSEYEATIRSLWSTVKNFAAKFPKFIDGNNLMNFVSNDGGESYNMCHFWSNFEIVSLDFYRSDAYRAYFDFLDKSGGFFYERWGDAPVHSIAAALLLDKKELHFFDGLGFHHPNFFSCPIEESVRLQNKCICDPEVDDTWHDYYFCTRQFFDAEGYKKPYGIDIPKLGH